MYLSRSDRAELKTLRDESMDFVNSVISHVKTLREVDEETESIFRESALPFEKELADLFTEESVSNFSDLEELGSKFKDIIERMMSHLESL
jgi:hypothetical protein